MTTPDKQASDYDSLDKDIENLLTSVYGSKEHETTDYREVLSDKLAFAHNSISVNDMMLAQQLIMAVDMIDSDDDRTELLDNITAYSPAMHPDILAAILNKPITEKEAMLDYLTFNHVIMEKVNMLVKELLMLLTDKQDFEDVILPVINNKHD